MWGGGSALRVSRRILICLRYDNKRVQSGVDIYDVRLADRYEKGEKRLYVFSKKSVEKRV